MNHLCNNTKEEQVYKSYGKKDRSNKNTPELDLYNLDNYIGDIWEGANLLSRLDDENCKEEIWNNICYYISARSPNKRKKHNAWVTYHKIVTKNTTREREPNEYDGMFSIEFKNRIYYQLLFSTIIDICEKENLSVMDVFVIKGYGEGGENLKRRGRGDKNE